jgi:hypothetical protein
MTRNSFYTIDKYFFIKKNQKLNKDIRLLNYKIDKLLRELRHKK